MKTFYSNGRLLSFGGACACIVPILLALIPAMSIAQLQPSVAAGLPLRSHSAPCNKLDLIATSGSETTATEVVAALPAKNSPTVRATYIAGLLTVRTEGATLAQVLDAIRAATGAEFEAIPEGQDCVMADVSGSPRQVIFDVLNGSGFGYIILATPENPEGLQRVILSKLSPLESAHGPRLAQTSGREALAIPMGSSTRTSDAASDDAGASAVSSRARADAGAPTQAALAQAESLPVPAENSSEATAPQQKQAPVNAATKFLEELYRLRQQQQQSSKSIIPPQ